MSRPAIPADAFSHGDHRRYNRGCRCTPCVKAATADRRRSRYLRQTGRGALTAPDRAAAHIRLLRAAGMTDQQIRQTGTSPDVFYAILRGARPIRRTTEARILRITPPVAPGGRNGARTDSTGTVRRLQTLAANGWPTRHLAPLLGKHHQYVQVLQNQTGPHVRQWLADEVRDLYAQLRDLTPEEHGVAPHYARAARERAAANGWPTSDYWDDDDLDNPDFRAATSSRVSRKEVIAEDAAWLLGAGCSREHVAERLDVSWNYIDKSLRAAREQQGVAA